MNVQEVLDLAIGGELSQLGLAKHIRTTGGDAATTATNSVIGYINLGLVELYKRFNLSTAEHVVEMVEGQTLYTLPGDCNAILSVFTEDGTEITLNDETDPTGVMSPSYNTLQILYPSAGEGIYVVYAQAPTFITNWDGVADLSLVTVPIPYALLEALLHYVGYRGHGSIDGNINAENNTHYIRFEQSCKNASTYGTITQDFVSEVNWITSKGFV